MGSINDIHVGAVVGVVIALVVMLATEQCGFLLGRRARRRRDAGGGGGEGQVVALEAAVLGLLGLLLGFSFSAGIARFGERRVLLLHEANAVGTAYLRADLLPDAERDRLREALRDYAGLRVELFDEGFGVRFDEIVLRSERAHGEIWSAAAAGVEARPAAVMAVLPPVNEVIDLHTLHIAAMERHTPLLATGGLLLTCMTGLVIVGFSFGLAANPHRWLARLFATLITAVLWINFDMDYPRIGLIRIDNSAMEGLHQSLQRHAGAGPHGTAAGNGARSGSTQP